jgi:predicted nucleotidyltransferase
MEDWEKALSKFLIHWKKREDVLGILVCGSYITGNPTNRSDIDLHILTSEEIDWRERGSKIVDGYIIEYFINPPKQIRTYFLEDNKSNRIDSQTQFITGKTLYDRDGSVAELKKEADEWLKKGFRELEEINLSIGKYGLWDSLDNLKDIYESKSKSFKYAYYDALRRLFWFYSKYLRWEVYSPIRIYELMTDSSTQKKYLQSSYPDSDFRDMFLEAITVVKESEMLNLFELLVKYIHDKTGGFEMDGWVIRTPLEIINKE